MDTLNELSESGSFATDLAKTFALSAASTAGLLGGMIVVGFLLEARQKRNKKKATTPVTTDK